MKRRRDQTDSLELFLDTICNTFGGIIFLAILVAILSQTRGMMNQDNPDADHALTPAEVRQLKQRLADAQSRVERLSLASEGFSQEPVTPEAMQFIQNRNQVLELQRAIDSLSGQIPDLEKQIKLLNESNADLEVELREVPVELVALKDDVAKQRAEISDVIQQKQTLLKLPRETNTSQSSALALLKGGFIYWAGEYDSLSGSFDGPHVTVKKGILGMEVVPTNGRGITADSSEFQRLVAQAESSRKIITLATWPDSFGTFQKAKPVLLNESVKYQLWVQTTDALIVHITSSPNNRAQ